MNNNVSEIIKEGIDKHGANEYYNLIACNLSYFENQFKDAILNEIQKYIKPSKIDTIEDLAQLLDGNEYRDELYNEYGINVSDICKNNKWVIIYGASDDLIEFNGFIDDEDGAWDGALCKLVKPGDFYLKNEDEETYKKSKNYKFVPISENELNIIKNNNYKDTCVVEQLWCPDDSEASWQVNVKGVPFARFNIMEDEELYCEAAVIDLSSLVK